MPGANKGISGHPPGWRKILNKIVLATYMSGSVGLVIVELVDKNALPGLAAIDLPAWVGDVLAVAILGGVIVSASTGQSGWKRYLPAVGWAFVAAISLIGPFQKEAGAEIWVGVAQALVIAVASAYVGRIAPLRILQASIGLMLLLFGLIHIRDAAVISSLIPEWIPLRAWWPFITGPVMLTAGVLLLLVRSLASIAAYAIAAMFLAWLPLVHLQRLAQDPGSAFEWAFALTALILAGVCLLAAHRYDQLGDPAD